MTEATPKLSVFIIARDEEDRIPLVIRSVIDWVDEVLVVDSGSLDETVAVSEALGAKVLHRNWEGFGPQKVFAEEQCRNDWILAIDADEPLSDELAREIQDLFSSGDYKKADYYWTKIANIFPFEEKPAPWAFKVKRVSLYDRRKAGFSSSIVHDNVVPAAGAREGRLENVIVHHSHRSLEFQVGKYNAYTKLQVKDLAAKGRRLPRIRLITEFPLAFFKAYVQRKYMFYGFWGIVLAINYAYLRFLRVAKAYEHDIFPTSDDTKGE